MHNVGANLLTFNTTYMKKFFALIFCFVGICAFSQSEIRTVQRPDGVTLKYFNPLPVAIHSNFEAGLALYKNVTNDFYLVALTVLFKTSKPTELSGDLMIQTTGTKGILLESVFHKLVDMNGRKVASSMYLLTESDIMELKKSPIKLIAFEINGSPIGLNLTKNKSILVTEMAKL